MQGVRNAPTRFPLVVVNNALYAMPSGRSACLVAARYLRNTHIAQPATSTPPRNIAKQ
jgi:hypothetical protein